MKKKIIILTVSAVLLLLLLSFFCFKQQTGVKGVSKSFLAPSIPLALNAENIADGVRLSWLPAQGGTNPLAGYTILRSSDGATFDQLAIVSMDTTEFLDTNGSEGFTYAVESFDDQTPPNYSEKSNLTSLPVTLPVVDESTFDKSISDAVVMADNNTGNVSDQTVAQAAATVEPEHETLSMLNSIISSDQKNLTEQFNAFINKKVNIANNFLSISPTVQQIEADRCRANSGVLESGLALLSDNKDLIESLAICKVITELK